LLWLEVAAALRDLLPAGWTLEFRWIGMVENAAARASRFHARRLGVADIVTFVPHTPMARAEFEKFDLFAMTSWEDPCPLVVLENMAMGKPVLCFSDGGGAAEEIGDSGIAVPSFRPDLMAAAAAELALNRDRRRALGEAARKRFRSLFTASVQSPKLLHEIRMCVRRS
jgi:glycosyltransferase involved in cell wall biosynthesis